MNIRKYHPGGELAVIGLASGFLFWFDSKDFFHLVPLNIISSYVLLIAFFLLFHAIFKIVYLILYNQKVLKKSIHVSTIILFISCFFIIISIIFYKASNKPSDKEPKSPSHNASIINLDVRYEMIFNNEGQLEISKVQSFKPLVKIDKIVETGYSSLNNFTNKDFIITNFALSECKCKEILYESLGFEEDSGKLTFRLYEFLDVGVEYFRTTVINVRSECHSGEINKFTILVENKSYKVEFLIHSSENGKFDVNRTLIKQVKSKGVSLSNSGVLESLITNREKTIQLHFDSLQIGDELLFEWARQDSIKCEQDKKEIFDFDICL